MDSLKSHRDLLVWQQAIALATVVYQACRELPGDVRCSLTPLLRKSAASIANHIAAGAARHTLPESLQFLHLARGSISELETQLMIAIDQGDFPAGRALLDRVAVVDRLLREFTRGLAGARLRAHARACRAPIIPAAPAHTRPSQKINHR